jgi:hypothetical protein
VLYLQELEHDGILYTTPSQDYDDSYQIEYARRHGGVIVTNDLFRDAVDKLKPHMRGALRVWMKSHLLSYTFVADEFCMIQCTLMSCPIDLNRNFSYVCRPKPRFFISSLNKPRLHDPKYRGKGFQAITTMYSRLRCRAERPSYAV